LLDFDYQLKSSQLIKMTSGEAFVFLLAFFKKFWRFLKKHLLDNFCCFTSASNEHGTNNLKAMLLQA